MGCSDSISVLSGTAACIPSIYADARAVLMPSIVLQADVDSAMAAHYPDVANMRDLKHEQMFELMETKLPYARALASEGLRLHPSVPKDIKFAVNDDTLPDGTPVYAGQAVCYCPYAMGRNPNIWPV